MIKFKKFTLQNGLKVIVHEDHSTPLVVMNILYDVGARDEHPSRTGFAHLFEHLMFGGSVNIPEYDTVLQKVGGTNNAFTNNDITNYYLMLPSVNIETAFWLESDRMLGLAFSPKSLSVQKKVVCEEYKERYLNQPYEDSMLFLRALAYKVHPYRWSTIGKNLSHIKNTTLSDVKDFFKKYYCPSNAIMVVAGNTSYNEVKKLSKKWFEPIPAGKKPNRKLPIEPVQNKSRKQILNRKVPVTALYKAYHTCSRYDKQYYAMDLLSDVLGGGESGRLKNELVKKKQLFSSIAAYQTGSYDKGLFIISGKLHKGVSEAEAEKALQSELDKLKKIKIPDVELTKIKNQIESSFVFEDMDLLNRAMNLAFSELLGSASLLNKELLFYKKVTEKDIMQQAQSIFKDKNCSTIYYKAIGI